MRNNWKNSAALFIVFLLLLVSACKKDDHAHADEYTCPMHPTVISDQPGSCPVCGMDLVRKAREGEEVTITEDLAQTIKSPNEVVIASIKTIKGEYKRQPVLLELQGIVTYDTRNLYTISSRTSGRLERVFLKYPFQFVKRGQKVAEIYSPELITAQRELLFVLQNDPQNETLINSSKERLRLLGASDSQLNTLIKTKEIQNTFALYSLYDGYVLSETQQPPAATQIATPSSTGGAGMSDMQGSASNTTSTSATNSQPGVTQSLIQEGSYVTTGQTLFKIINASALRVELNVPSSSVGLINKGDEAMLDFGHDDHQTATVDFIQPYYNEGQEFLTIRIYTQKTEKLHIGHLVQSQLKSNSVEALWIPRDAVIDLGVDKVIFIKEKNVFKPRKVVTGIQTEKEIEIKMGLSSSDEIAAQAQYLIDSESFVKLKP